MFMQRKTLIDTFNNFGNIGGAGPKPKQRQKNSWKFRDNGSKQNELELKSMRF